MARYLPMTARSMSMGNGASVPLSLWHGAIFREVGAMSSRLGRQSSWNGLNKVWLRERGRRQPRVLDLKRWPAHSCSSQRQQQHRMHTCACACCTQARMQTRVKRKQSEKKAARPLAEIAKRARSGDRLAGSSHDDGNMSNFDAW